MLFVARSLVVTPHRSVELSAFLYLWASLLAGELLYQAYVAVSGVEYRPYFSWYRSPSFIFWTVTASLVALFALERIRPVRLLSPLVRWAPLGLSLLTVAVAIYLFAGSIGFTSKLYAARYDAALWIASNSPPGTTFAAWNAGQLGYFSDRVFINLDGVINDVDYYERVLRGPVPLVDYLAENKVDYVVDYAIYDSIPDFPVVQAFPLDDGSGRAIQVWQVPPR
jgi:phosphoglycerol transferase MdoB-like AlkP superfamily enzyme